VYSPNVSDSDLSDAFGTYLKGESTGHNDFRARPPKFPRGDQTVGPGRTLQQARNSQAQVRAPTGAKDARICAICFGRSGTCSHAAPTGGDYELCAVVRHIGIGAIAGHYVSDVRADAGAKGHDHKPIWKRCNDSVVSFVTEDKVISEQDTPYILFYSKI